MPFKIQADGEWPHRSGFSAARDVEALAIDFGFQLGIYRIQKVLAVLAQMEPQKVVAQHPVQQFLLPGKAPEYFRIGPRNVPELRHDQVRIPLLQHRRQQREMVVLNEHKGWLVAGFLKRSEERRV